LFIILLTLSVILNIGLVAYYWRNRRAKEDAVELQAAALYAAANAIAITDRNGIIQWANPAFTRLTGYTFNQAQGQHMRVLRSDKHSNAFYRNLKQTIESGLIWEDEIINVRKDGREYIEQQIITPIRNEKDEITHCDLNDLLQDIVDWAVEFMDAHFCEIMFLNGDELVVRAFTHNRFFWLLVIVSNVGKFP
jgi:PAS domain S-box-containing protein